jgi:hypothetical protein
MGESYHRVLLTQYEETIDAVYYLKAYGAMDRAANREADSAKIPW